MNFAARTLALQGLAIAAAALGMSAVVVHEAKAAQQPQAAVVKIGNFTFGPQALAVRAGTTVTWINEDDIPHSVVARDGAFKSKVLDTGDRFSFTFAKAGTFGYFCSLHPHMTGHIVVR